MESCTNLASTKKLTPETPARKDTMYAENLHCLICLKNASFKATLKLKFSTHYYLSFDSRHIEVSSSLYPSYMFQQAGNGNTHDFFSSFSHKSLYLCPHSRRLYILLLNARFFLFHQ